MKQPGRREVVNVSRPHLALAAEELRIEAMNLKAVGVSKSNHPRRQQLIWLGLRMERPNRPHLSHALEGRGRLLSLHGRGISTSLQNLRRDALLSSLYRVNRRHIEQRRHFANRPSSGINNARS